MADKIQWTNEEENEKLALQYLNESYASGVVDNFMATYNVFEGKKLSEKKNDGDKK
ncbi:hypothetical protein JOD43_003678 [Pullulanibacillus pueri]|uniref:Uncharacterized protein n=1 Tax=Pullulanibacillus pueri TaxID=1437324 RepID=A0A8J2ZZU5_9BACL|nr:hypothetical protein [Pullulanibacillus pueri]MBM7683498.1 hypothetical protein [Pullulanibacillus pueri]GGH86687.1 hypothetical protein GCM10007096_34970 [Pullulanibacillus pueri]